MLIGQGEDGATAVVQGEASYAQAWLRRQDQPADLIPDCTESDHLSVWRAAPGGVVVLPERYTPTYAYPALIWLAEPGQDELTVRGWLEEISSRNFVGIGLRPELYAPAAVSTDERQPSGCGSGRTGLARFLSFLQSIEPWVRLHPDRRYVAAKGAAARTAVRWLLTRPQSFAGAIAIQPESAPAASWRTAAPLTSSRRVLWIGDQREPTALAADALALQCLGLLVETVVAAADASPTALASQINRWVLKSITTAVLD